MAVEDASASVLPIVRKERKAAQIMGQHKEGETSGLIEGNTGVFMIKVTKKEAASKMDNYSTYANTLKTAAAGKVNSAVYNALKEASDIEDKRDTFY